MPLKNIKCPSCHAPVEVPARQAGRCPYCDAVVERSARPTAPPHQAGAHPGADRPPATVGGQVAAAISPHTRKVLVVLSALLTLAAVGTLLSFLFTRDGWFGELAIACAVLFGLASLLWTRARARLLGVGVAGLGGLALGLKPLLFPMWSEGFGVLEPGPYSLTSETHLYFLVPAGALLVLAAILGLSLPARGGDKN